MRYPTNLRNRSQERCVPITGANAVTAFERHYTPAELGELWRYHESTIIRMFQDEPGVVKKGRQNRRDGKRDYVTLRIPESVALRVHSELSK